jgi:hypothetical protein
MKRPRKAIRIGGPVLVIGVLALLALWRIGAPGSGARSAGPGERLEPLTRIADLTAATSVLRRASLENVRVQALPSDRTAWIDSGSAPLVPPSIERVFAVLDPDVRRPADLTWQPGARVTLIGLVRPSPASADAIRQWHIDAATAAELQQRGTYLHVTEIRAVN